MLAEAPHQCHRGAVGAIERHDGGDDTCAVGAVADAVLPCTPDRPAPRSAPVEGEIRAAAPGYLRPVIPVVEMATSVLNMATSAAETSHSLPGGAAGTVAGDVAAGSFESAATEPAGTIAADPDALAVEVVIPLRWAEDGADRGSRVSQMRDYLESLLAATPHVTVVDGSAPEAFARHRATWPAQVRHVRPAAHPRAAGPVNGKVLGALTGIRMAREELVVLADDDVRLSADDLASLVHRLADADLVRPVNVFDSWPISACWDGARTLLNSAIANDWPGVFGLRRSAVLAAGGWSPQVLFENLELWRTMQAHGARTRVAPDIVIKRQPSTTAHFWSQRVRQAYDDLAQPGRLATELAILPVALTLAVCNRRMLLAAGCAVVALAEVGRRRIGEEHVPAAVAFAAPVWLLERGVCVWLALGSRSRGGVPYHGQRLRVAAHSRRQLSRCALLCPRHATYSAHST